MYINLYIHTLFTMLKENKRAKRYALPRISFLVQLYTQTNFLLEKRCDELGQTKTAIINNLIVDFVRQDLLDQIDQYTDELTAIRHLVKKYHTLPKEKKNEMISDIVDFLDNHSLMDPIVEDWKLRGN